MTERFMFYRINRDAGAVRFEEAGSAWYEEGKGTVVRSDDERLKGLLTNPIGVREGATKPYHVKPDERRYLAEVANGLFDSGYIGRLGGEHA